MTTELEDAVAKWIDKTAIAEFAKAAEKLKSRDVMASLCEDRQTVMLYLNYDDDAATRTASFMLPEPLAEGEKFDAEFYEGLLRWILTERQLEIVAYAARDIPLGLREDFAKYIFDCLRPKREIANTDVAYFCAAALHKFAPPQRRRA
jgi:hypothetical protein